MRPRIVWTRSVLSRTSVYHTERDCCRVVDPESMTGHWLSDVRDRLGPCQYCTGEAYPIQPEQ